MVELLRKLLLAGVVVFLGRGTVLQVTFGLLVSILAHITHAGLLPFVEPDLNRLQHGSLAALWLTLLGGLVLQTNSVESGTAQGDLLGAVLALLSVAVVVMGGVVVVFTARNLRTKALRALAQRKNKQGAAGSAGSEEEDQEGPQGTEVEMEMATIVMHEGTHDEDVDPEAEPDWCESPLAALEESQSAESADERPGLHLQHQPEQVDEPRPGLHLQQQESSGGGGLTAQ